MLSRPASWFLAMTATLAIAPLFAQAPAAKGAAPPPKVPRPQLFLKEEWKQTAAGGEHPVAADSIGNSNVELQLHVPTGEILLTGSPGDDANPTHVWTGMCASPCAVTFRDKHHYADLTGAARTWRRSR